MSYPPPSKTPPLPSSEMTPRAIRRTPHEEVGLRVRALRDELGYRQVDLARLAKVHTTYVSKLEAGKLNPSVDHVVEIAFALGVNPATLVADLIPRDLRGRRPRGRPTDDPTGA
jgi:transcriptional regulator with XRE-family HTH domain